MTFDDDIFGTDTDSRPKAKRRRVYTRQNLGALHDLVTRACPDLTTKGDVCDLNLLAKELSLSYQAVYKWMRPNHKPELPYKQAKRIVELSKRQKLNTLDAEERADWRPVAIEDFLPFVIGA